MRDFKILFKKDVTFARKIGRKKKEKDLYFCLYEKGLSFVQKKILHKSL